jgi:RimJ/RimL family protein N-acetyltransferase
MNTWIKPTTLEGKIVKLVPLEINHREGLIEAVSDGNLSELWYTAVPSKNTIDKYIEAALKEQANEKSLPFVVIEKASGKIIGATRYLNIEAEHQRLEIGYTFYAKSVQRTGVNTECKYLLLQHAFETLQCIAVEFRTHWHNQPSRIAIERLGAKLDGVLRNHKIMGDGLIRDTVVYSILNTEWPSVKQSLEFKLKP